MYSYNLQNTNPLKIDDIYIKKHLAMIANDDFDSSMFFLDFLPVHEERIRKYKQYTTQKNSIDDRQKPESQIVKAFNKIHNSYYNLIVDQKVGYTFGEPITYNVSDDAGEGAREKIRGFLNKQDIFITNTINGTQQGACGVSYALLDIESDGEKETTPTIKVVDSWNGYVLDEKKAAVYLEDDYVINIGFVKRLHLITPEKIQTYRSVVSGLNIKPQFQLEREVGNLLGVITLAEFKNNNDMQADFETVEDLIDGYDRVVSSSQDEVEQFRWAYMFIFGSRLDQEEAEKLYQKQTGILNVKDAGGKAEFVTKDMPTDFFNSYLKLLSDNIYKFSKSIDVNDPAFAGGSESGEARKWKLIALEFKANTTEAFFKKGMNNLLLAIVAYFNIIGGCDKLERNHITMKFTRTLPVDLGYLAGVITQLREVMSDERVLSMLPDIDDPKEEIKKRLEEQKEKAKIQAEMFDSYDDKPFNEGGEGHADGGILEDEEETTSSGDDEERKSDAEKDKKGS